MKILVVCDRYPYPLTNGQNLRIYHYARALRGRHEFDLLCYGDGAPPPEIRPLFGRVDVVPRPGKPAPMGGWQGLRASLDPAQFVVASEKARARLTELLAGTRYDLVWMSGWDMIVNLPERPDVPLLADAVDDGVLEWWNAFRAARGWDAVRKLKGVWLNARFERRYFGPAQGVLFVSDKDAGVFQRLNPATPTYVVNNGVDADFFAPWQGTPSTDELVFEGNMSFAPNVDAAQWFVRDILPLIHRERPAAHLSLVGNRPAPEVQTLAGEAVTVTGFVDDVRPYLGRAAVFVCPMRMGAGIKNKILQAWAMGKAVVGTPECLGGLEAQPGVNIEVARSAEEFARVALALLADPERAAALGRAARATIERHYTWARKADELDAVFTRVAGRPALAGAAA